MTKSTRYNGWHVQPNLQNAHMLESLLNVSKTTHQLVKMGITITGTVMGTAHPTILVMATGETKKLKGAAIKTRNLNGTRTSVYSAQLNNCTIEWESKNVH